MENKEELTTEDKNLIEENDELLDDLKDLCCCNCDPKDCENCKNGEGCGFVPIIFGSPMYMFISTLISLLIVVITFVFLKDMLF